MSNQSKVGRFRVLVLSTAMLCGVGHASPPAQAAAPDGYVRIVPYAPRTELSAAAISALCSAIAAQKIADCAPLAAAQQFCANPMNMMLPRPPTSELDALAKAATCPERVAAAAPFKGSAKGAGLFGLGWQDALVNGLAAFLIDRAKAEALAAAAERFRSGVCGNAQGKRLMPLTCAFLDTSDPYKVPVSWGAVKATVQKDLHELPLRILEVGVPLWTKDMKDAPELLYAAVDLAARSIAERQDPAPLLVGLRYKFASAARHCADVPMACALLGAGIASEVILPGYTSAAAAQPNFVPIATRVILDQVSAAGLVPTGTAAPSLTDSLQNDLPRVLAAIDNASAKGTAAKAGKKTDDIVAYASALTSIATVMTSAFAPSTG